MENKGKVLKKFLGYEPSENDLENYEVLTDKEANVRVKEYIIDSLWAFRTNFILGFLDLPDWFNGDRIEKSFQKFQTELCEDASPIIALMLGKKIDQFIKEAVRADGRGHFLAGYDGKENEIKYNNKTYYIYRQN